jgi:hypothetical protein
MVAVSKGGPKPGEPKGDNGENAEAAGDGDGTATGTE